MANNANNGNGTGGFDAVNELCLEALEALLDMVATKEAEIADLRAKLKMNAIVVDADEIQLDPKPDIPSILIVARGSLMTDILHMLFQRAGYADVHETNDLSEAAAMVQHYRPDIVVYDTEGWNVMGVNTAFIEELKNSNADSKVIGILPGPSREDLMKLARHGVKEVLIKPVDTLRLVQIVKRMVDEGAKIPNPAPAE